MPNIDPTTLNLIEQVDVYEQALADGSIPDDESLQALQESVTALLVQIWEQTSNFFGFPCGETDCPARDLNHEYGDSVCGYEREFRRKDKPSREVSPNQRAFNQGYGPGR